MNPKPFASLNHFTVPVAMLFFRVFADGLSARALAHCGEERVV
jgi:hypothetical protein